MLLPRYSLRVTLWIITGCAAFFLILGWAVQGTPWAVVVSVSVGCLVLLLLFHALLYLLASGFTSLVGQQALPARTSRGGVQLTSDEQSPPSLSNNSESI